MVFFGKGQMRKKVITGLDKTIITSEVRQRGQQQTVACVIAVFALLWLILVLICYERTVLLTGW